jgi:hypothetical protein
MLNRRALLLVVGSLTATAASLFLAYYLGAFQRRAAMCRITLSGARDASTSIVLDDPDEIEELVLKPIRLARPDFFPEDYRSFAHLELEYEDGTVERYWLFSPLGCYKKGESYYVASLGKLGREIKRRLEGKEGMERLIKTLD